MGEAPAVFGDALRRLAAAATYLYQDGPRFWYATQPTVTKLAEDRAEQLRRDPDQVAQELQDARLVVLPAEHPYSKEPGSAAEVAARAILESRGSTPRLYQNTLVFLAADRVRLQDLDEALRRFLAWESIVAEKETLNLDPARAGRDASRIADEVIAHLAGQVGADVKVTLEIDASLPDAATEQIVRTVTQNSRTLKFTSHGFESE